MKCDDHKMVHRVGLAVVKFERSSLWISYELDDIHTLSTVTLK